MEGIGRVDGRLELAKAIAIATSLAIERRVLLYIHDKQGWISKRVDFSVPGLLESSQAQESNAEDLRGMHATSYAENSEDGRE